MITALLSKLDIYINAAGSSEILNSVQFRVDFKDTELHQE
jgi:hypothetical protein